jgi:uncharacterized protein YndB with AHSA1/START domain
MSAATKPQTEIVADPNLPTIRITREFDASPQQVFRAWTDPELVAQWMGPRSTTTRIDRWDCRTGGNYRYVSVHEGVEYGFYGAFHEVRPDERLVQTFTFEDMPDGVALDTTTFEAIDDGRTRITTLSVVESLEMRDGMIASGMETGVVEGYEKLDELLAGPA